MHTKILLTAAQLILAYGVMGQTSPPEQIPCYEDPFALIKNADIKIDKQAILVIGEIKKNGRLTYIPDLYMTKAIALFGGITPNTSGFVRIFRGKEILNSNINLIKKGLEKDVLLEKGDIVYLPVRCSKKQFLDKIKQDFQRLLNLRDYPPVKRKSKNSMDQKMV